MTEHDVQKAFIQWFRRTYPTVMIFAIPNGGSRDIRVAKKLSFEGVLSGVYDLFVPAYSLFIEMKRDKRGRLSRTQKAFRDHVESIGYQTIVGFGLDDAIEKVRSVIPLRQPSSHSHRTQSDMS